MLADHDMSAYLHCIHISTYAPTSLPSDQAFYFISSQCHCVCTATNVSTILFTLTPFSCTPFMKGCVMETPNPFVYLPGQYPSVGDSPLSQGGMLHFCLIQSKNILEATFEPIEFNTFVCMRIQGAWASFMNGTFWFHKYWWMQVHADSRQCTVSKCVLPFLAQSKLMSIQMSKPLWWILGLAGFDSVDSVCSFTSWAVAFNQYPAHMTLWSTQQITVCSFHKQSVIGTWCAFCKWCAFK